VSGNATRHQLFVINPDGTGETSYPPGGAETFANYAVFSPDGMRIAFTQHDGQADNLWVMEADGASKMQLTALGGRMGALPGWSPDSRKIVFVASHQLYIVNADGSSGLKPEPVPLDLSGVNAPVWSGK
jgi:TolB protein